ncbi:hypothetical protein QLQ12_26725 [Actinoplanes sp. NEAU-A12]|uniref:Uncharacterized protein n=1 Tax=Actinoplanes sandaracinus TaxID=3045177 RepID=A0ABT6WR54_9ACTN|nr:hypothetical protein [Actinoplanes sandaracinus]MDI6102217.1 hypothetical protein [Actinoplanes sandaracinus]
MTPEQHAVRAEELAAEAEQLYVDVRLEVEAGDDIDEPIWRWLDTTVQLGQLHATLALRQPAGQPFTAGYEGAGPDDPPA